MLVERLRCRVQHGGPDLLFGQPNQLSGEFDLTVHILGQTACRNDGLIHIRRLDASPSSAPRSWDLLLLVHSVSPLAQRQRRDREMVHCTIVAAVVTKRHR
jgi:hypothetical protein